MIFRKPTTIQLKSSEDIQELQPPLKKSNSKTNQFKLLSKYPSTHLQI
jgi:hypothetical protein